MRAHNKFPNQDLSDRFWADMELAAHCPKKAAKDRAHLSTFKFFIFEKFSCFIVLVVFLVIVQSSELPSVSFCEKMTFFTKFY